MAEKPPVDSLKNLIQDFSSSDSLRNAEMFKSLKEFLLILDSPTRFDLLQAIFVYRRLTLSQISQLLQLSKPTVLHHLKKFEEFHFVQISEIKATHGPLPTKVYQFNEEIFNELTRSLNYFINLQSAENPEEFLLAIKSKQFFFTMIASIFRKTQEFYAQYEHDFKQYLRERPEKIPELIAKRHTWFNIDYLSTSRKTQMVDAIKENKIPLRTPDFQSSPGERYEIHPYMMFSVLLPIPEIIKFSPFNMENL